MSENRLVHLTRLSTERDVMCRIITQSYKAYLVELGGESERRGEWSQPRNGISDGRRGETRSVTERKGKRDP